MGYPGGKNGAGVYQRIINQIPPHHTYVEAFAGGAAVFRHMRRSAWAILVEVDQIQADRLRRNAGADVVINGCGIQWLFSAAPDLGSDAFVYLDPPYLHETRTSNFRYRCEIGDLDHAAMIEAAKRLSCSVAISGYPSAMYDALLPDWRRLDYVATTRGGPRVECLWMNYDAPAALHDYSYLGEDREDRRRIKRKIDRLVNTLSNLPGLERGAILAALESRVVTPGRVAGCGRRRSDP